MINLITNHYSNTNNACVNENKHATNQDKLNSHFKARYKSKMLKPQQITQILSQLDVDPHRPTTFSPSLKLCNLSWS